MSPPNVYALTKGFWKFRESDVYCSRGIPKARMLMLPEPHSGRCATQSACSPLVQAWPNTDLRANAACCGVRNAVTHVNSRWWEEHALQVFKKCRICTGIHVGTSRHYTRIGFSNLEAATARARQASSSLVGGKGLAVE